MRNQTLIERWPPFVHIFASSHPILNALTIVPLVALLLIYGAPEMALQKSPIYLGLAAVAWVYWTFFEYGFHRWVYHGKYRPGRLKDFVDSFHIYHHRNLEDHRVLTAGPMMIVPIGAFLLAPWWLVLHQSPDLFAMMAISLLVNYYFYEWVHFLIHRSNMKNRYIRFISEFHNHHHEKNWTKNFGNTTSLWDHLCGTYEK